MIDAVQKVHTDRIYTYEKREKAAETGEFSKYMTEQIQKQSADENADSNVGGNPEPETKGKDDYARMIREQIETLYEKIKNGETEESYQIGNSSFTIKEWDNLLAQFDSVQEAVRKLVEEEMEQRENREKETM